MGICSLRTQTFLGVRLAFLPNLRSGVIFFSVSLLLWLEREKNSAWYIHLTSHQPPPNLHNLTSTWSVMLLANQRLRHGNQILAGIMGAIHSTKIPTGPTAPQKVDPFFRNFSGWTVPIHWVLDRNFRKFWLNGSRPMSLSTSILRKTKFLSTFRWRFLKKNF